MFPFIEIAYDTVKWSMMFVISKWMTGGSFTDKAWQMSSLYTLLGFLTYNVSTRNFIETGKGNKKLVLDDLVKFGTMFITARFLSGGSLLNSAWLYGTFATLMGFIVYDLVTVKLAKGNQLTYITGLQNTIDDWVKFGTMCVVSRLVSCETLLDPKWFASCIGILTGFTVFDVMFSGIIDPMSTRRPL